VQEFKQRENVYMVKRQQLRSLELQYRKELDRQVLKGTGFNDKYSVNLEIIDELSRQLGDNLQLDNSQEQERQGLRARIDE